MFEKVNPSHPDKIADRIAGALVDMAYRKGNNPRIAVEVLIGHGMCHVIAETSVSLLSGDSLSHGYGRVREVVERIAGHGIGVDYRERPQDTHLAENQEGGIRCGDNGIFKGCPTTLEQRRLSEFMRDLYALYPYDGKAVVHDNQLTLCQSNADSEELAALIGYPVRAINPLGEWEGGTNVDCGATNRKLGSDMGDAVTGGGLHGKDLSKADVSVNIACHLLAQSTGRIVTASCAIGDDAVSYFFDGSDDPLVTSYETAVSDASMYVQSLGGFEKLAEWGLV